MNRPAPVRTLRHTDDGSRPPHVTRTGVALVLAAWAVYSVLAAVPLAAGRGVPFITAFGWQIGQSAALFALSIPVWFIVIRAMHGTGWYWKALAHSVLGPAYALAGYLYLYQTVQWFAGQTSANTIQTTSIWLVYSNLVVYILQFTLYHSYEILRKLRLKERLTLELIALSTEQELSTLRAQMNPHFLFNTLNSISALTATDVEGTRSMIAALADLLRYATDSARKPFVPLKDEVAFVNDYLALEARRMGDRLTSTVKVDQELLSSPVPPMILQPLVENAIRHGIAPEEEGGEVCVRIRRAGEGMVVQITDNGVGLSSADPLGTAGGVGLKNTDARLRKIYGGSAGITIRPGPEKGCEVSFKLPLR
jgi:two-component system, LytTR family, sensor kinase